MIHQIYDALLLDAANDAVLLSGGSNHYIRILDTPKSADIPVDHVTFETYCGKRCRASSFAVDTFYRYREELESEDKSVVFRECTECANSWEHIEDAIEAQINGSSLTLVRIIYELLGARYPYPPERNHQK